jgi:hypothetical protein
MGSVLDKIEFLPLCTMKIFVYKKFMVNRNYFLILISSSKSLPSNQLIIPEICRTDMQELFFATFLLFFYNPPTKEGRGVQHSARKVQTFNFKLAFLTEILTAKLL